MYHGTTKEQLRSIYAHGLRKGTYVSPDMETARWFAVERSKWNGQKPVVLLVIGHTDKVRPDRSGRNEARLITTSRSIAIAA